jgi:hypothetical protein
MKMSELGKVTPNDPVDELTRKKLDELGNVRLDIADRLLDMEMERIRLLVSVQRLDEERIKIFDKILMDRGLPPGTPVEVEAQTGALKILRPAKPEPKPVG